MTETKSAPRRTSRSKGLHVERTFSTEDIHPYDEVTWERLRTARSRVPRLLERQRLDDRHEQVLPWRPGHSCP